MLNYEITKNLVHERQHQLTHEAKLARLARNARRARHNGVEAGTSVDYKIVLPAPRHVHATAA